MEWVQYFWDPMQEDRKFQEWNPKTWWQSCAPEENVDNFYEELCARRIPEVDGPDKVHWGYSNIGNFSIAEAVALLTETHRMPKEDKMQQGMEGEPLAQNWNFQLDVTTSTYPNLGKSSEKRYDRSLPMMYLL